MKIFAKVMMVFTFLFMIFGLIRVVMFRVEGYSDYSTFNFLPSYESFNSWVNSFNLADDFVNSFDNFKSLVNSFDFSTDSSFFENVAKFFTGLWNVITCVLQLLVCVVSTPIKMLTWLFDFFTLDLVKSSSISQMAVIFDNPPLSLGGEGVLYPFFSWIK